MSGLLTPEFLSMVVGIIVSLLIALVPQFEAIKTELVAVVAVLVGLVIAAFGGERTMAARSSGSTQSERLSAKSESLKVPTVKSP
jgi:hypothetical protein